ncbi:hydroxyethylthiazole kinase [Mucilaginibacter paludis]|uniref:Hydroxyethylthiazole kinase n=1 Tax=Mucilaginibacter paludis DSM 18603 TaxID=714943 RepID=H1Y3N4_9SPHI|nr:hydroxyethylthiazole kinase [Mucilaginibacter paludis]EHQ30296.1 Hydroxyethylthiazole kinase [Mucilaginibacter paludis DSM 18603]
MKEQIWAQIIAVKQNSPLVHNITNYVVMNNTANALLAVGASPIMAHAHAELTEMVNIAGALVINIGTLDEYWVKSMLIAAEQANTLGKPWVLDPVGAGATTYRNEVLKQLLKLKPTVIRGNASEIMALASQSNSTKGVDSVHQSNDAVSAALRLNDEFGSVVCISGATDIIVNNDNTTRLSNGNSLMAKVTGLGCTATALTGAFLAVNPQDAFLATTAAMALLGVCGEIAADLSAGPGSLQVNLLDILYNLTEEEFFTTLKIS